MKNLMEYQTKCVEHGQANQLKRDYGNVCDMKIVCCGSGVKSYVVIENASEETINSIKEVEKCLH